MWDQQKEWWPQYSVLFFHVARDLVLSSLVLSFLPVSSSSLSWLSWLPPPVLPHLASLSPHKSRPLPPVCWITCLQSVSVSLFLAFLLIIPPPPLPVCSCWQHLLVGCIKEEMSKSKKSPLPASAHLPEPFGLIQQLLAVNLPNCREFWRYAAGQIAPRERGRLNQWCHAVRLQMGGFEVKSASRRIDTFHTCWM